MLTIEPELMRWARTSVGLTPHEASERLKVTEGQITEWESAGASLSPAQLDRVANCYRRPTAAFFLPAPPEEPPAPIDFRLFSDSAPHQLSRKTLLAIRRARWLQAAYGDFADGEPSPARKLRATVNDDIERLAHRARKAIGVPVEQQKSWRRTKLGFRNWRNVFENAGIPVFVFPLPAQDLRGCSLGGSLRQSSSTPRTTALRERRSPSFMSGAIFSSVSLASAIPTKAFEAVRMPRSKRSAIASPENSCCRDRRLWPYLPSSDTEAGASL